MRIIFFGTSQFAVPSLERLAKRHEIALCVTQPDRPQGRGLQPEPSPVKRAAERLDLTLAQPPQLLPEQFASLKPELGIVIAYGRLISRDLLAVPAHGMLGVHPSLLPKYRGAAPVAWALLNGERTTGVTIFRLSERLDDGDILRQQTVPVEPGEDAEQLTGRLAQLGAEELASGVDAIASGQASFTPQDDAEATLAPKLTKAQGRIDWSQSAETIERLVRGTTPWPGAVTEWEGTPVKILKAAADLRSTTASPGCVLGKAADGLLVAAGKGTLRITELQPAGKRRMSVKEFLASRVLKARSRFGSRHA